MNCPICGGEMWDNRGKKRNPKAPDYKCKDKSCEGVIWPPKGGRLSHDPVPASSSNPKWTWFRLSKTYERCLLLAEMRLKESQERAGGKAGLMFTSADLVAATATLFIEACKGGVEEPAAKLPPKKANPGPPPAASDAFEEDAEEVPF